MKKLLTLSASFFLVASLTLGQEASTPKPVIKSYDISQNYFGIGMLFENYAGNNMPGGQLTYEKTINELFGIGINGNFSMKNFDDDFITSKMKLIGFYPHVRAHTVELLNLPKYLDLYVTIGLQVRFNNASINIKSNDYSYKDNSQDVYLGYGLGAKFQVSQKMGFFIDYNRRNTFAIGLSFALNQKK